MNEQEYGYTVHTKFGPTSFGYSYRPLVEVAVSSEHKSGSFRALVDSGTEVTVMDLGIARFLGISPEGREKGQLLGLDAYKEGFIAPVSIKIDRFDAVFTFKVLFIEDLHQNFDIILGQQDFFWNFIVRFERSNKKFYLSLAPTPDETSERKL